MASFKRNRYWLSRFIGKPEAENAKAINIGLMRNSLRNAVTRYFRRNSGGIDYISIPLVSFTSDFELSFYTLHDGSGTFYLFGNSLNFYNRLSISSGGNFNYRTGSSGQELNGPVGSIPANVFNLVTISKVGANTEVSVNGISIVSGSPTGTLSIDQFFRNDSSVSGAGIIANVKLEDAGNKVRGYSIADSSDSVVDSVGGQHGTVINGVASDRVLFAESVRGGDWLGEELITQNVWENPASKGSEWSFSGNKWTLTGSGALSALSLIANSAQPDFMRVVGVVDSITGGLYLVVGATQSISLPGYYSNDISKSADTGQQYKRLSGVVTATLSKPSFKEILRVS